MRETEGEESARDGRAAVIKDAGESGSSHLPKSRLQRTFLRHMIHRRFLNGPQRNLRYTYYFHFSL